MSNFRFLAILSACILCSSLHAADPAPANSFLELLQPGQKVYFHTSVSTDITLTLTEREFVASERSGYVQNYTVEKVYSDYVLFDRKSLKWKDGKSTVESRYKVAVPKHKIAEILWSDESTRP